MGRAVNAGKILVSILLIGVLLMAIDFAGTSQAFGNDDASPSISLTVPNDCDFVLVCFAWYGAADAAPTSVTINSVSMTQVIEENGEWNYMSTSIWRLANPSTGSQNLEWSWGSTPMYGACIHVVYLKGVNADSSVRDSDSALVDATPDSLTLTTLSGDRVIGNVARYNSAPDASPTGSGQTDILNNDYNDTYAGSAHEDAVGASVEFSVSGTEWSSCFCVVALIPATGGYELSCDAGTYTYTGTAMAPLHGKVLSAAGGTYAQTGTAMTPLHNKQIGAGAGGYVMTGTTLSLLKSNKLNAEAGTYTYTGTALTILHAKLLTAGAGTYTFTGTAATLLHNKVISLGSGIYTVTGKDVTLTYTESAIVVQGEGLHVFMNPFLH